MEIILTEDIPKLGIAGQVVKVKNGFARNYLLPRGKALLATAGRKADLEHKRRVIEEAQRRLVGGLQETARRLANVALEFHVQAGEEGKLFGSVTTGEIANELVERGFDVDRRKILLEGPIKQLGDYAVTVRLHREVTAQIQVHVRPVAGEPAPPAAEEEGEEGEERSPGEEEEE